MFDTIKEILRKKDASSLHPIRSNYALSGYRVAILATDGFEQSELFKPKKALEEAGCGTFVVSLAPGRIRGWRQGRWGRSIGVDYLVTEALEMDFDFLLLPGGVINPDKLRNNEDAVIFVQSFVDANKPIAAICHGPQILIETTLLEGRTLTSFPSIKTDLINAGAQWVDEEVVVDDKLITSRNPDDIPSFNREMIILFNQIATNKAIPNTESFVTMM